VRREGDRRNPTGSVAFFDPEFTPAKGGTLWRGFAVSSPVRRLGVIRRLFLELHGRLGLVHPATIGPGILSVLTLVLLAGSVSGAGDDGERLFRHCPTPPAIRDHRFDLSSRRGWIDLHEAVDELRRRAEADAEASRLSRETLRAGRELSELSQPELVAYFQRSEDALDEKDAQALHHLARVVERVLSRETAPPDAASVPWARELAAVLANNHRPRVPRRIADVTMPFVLIDQAHTSIARGRRAAGNLAGGSEATPDSSLLDPELGTFWRRPEAIASADLYRGFGRSRLPDVADVVLSYVKPKTNYGTTPGFQLKDRRGRKIRVKFEEVHSEPFATRIFWALGFHVDPTDHVPSLKIRYDRRLLREFNVRRRLPTTFTALGVVPVFTMNHQPYHSPRDHLLGAVLKDGRHIPAEELWDQLFEQPDRERPEQDTDAFRASFEAEIDYLITGPVSIQVEDESAQSLGPWDFNQLDHADRRELRGLTLLAAWVGWYDTRFDNNRLGAWQRGGEWELRHVLSDLGGCLGSADGFFSGTNESPNAFEWVCTKPPRGRRQVRIVNFKPIDDVAPFAACTLEDARWMARWIARLSEVQLRQALVAAGFDSARVRLYEQKLVERRDRMMIDLGLADEVGLLRPGGVDRTFDYDPRVMGPVRVELEDGTLVEAPVLEARVERGRLRTPGGVE